MTSKALRKSMNACPTISFVFLISAVSVDCLGGNADCSSYDVKNEVIFKDFTQSTLSIPKIENFILLTDWNIFQSKRLVLD